MGVGQRGPPVCSATGCPQPNQALELTAPNTGFVALRGVVAWGPQLTAGVRCPGDIYVPKGKDRGGIVVSMFFSLVENGYKLFTFAYLRPLQTLIAK
jgi:hypothetical protein